MKDWFGRGIWFLVGMFLVIMGLYFLIHPDAALVSIAWLLGAAMLVSGASDLVVYLAAASGVYRFGMVFGGRDHRPAARPPVRLQQLAGGGTAALCAGRMGDPVRCDQMRRRGDLSPGGHVVLGRAAGDRPGHTDFRPGDLFQADIAAIAISAVVAVVLMAQGLMAVMRGLFASSLHR